MHWFLKIFLYHEEDDGVSEMIGEIKPVIDKLLCHNIAHSVIKKDVKDKLQTKIIKEITKIGIDEVLQHLILQISYMINSVRYTNVLAQIHENLEHIQPTNKTFDYDTSITDDYRRMNDIQLIMKFYPLDGSYPKCGMNQTMYRNIEKSFVSFVRIFYPDAQEFDLSASYDIPKETFQIGTAMQVLNAIYPFNLDEYLRDKSTIGLKDEILQFDEQQKLQRMHTKRSLLQLILTHRLLILYIECIRVLQGEWNLLKGLGYLSTPLDQFPLVGYVKVQYTTIEYVERSFVGVNVMKKCSRDEIDGTMHIGTRLHNILSIKSDLDQIIDELNKNTQTSDKDSLEHLTFFLENTTGVFKIIEQLTLRLPRESIVNQNL